jgi:hypothetical protein
MRVLLLLLLLSWPACASVLEDLDAAQQANLEKGEAVLRSEEVRGGPWPRLIVYVHVKAPVGGEARRTVLALKKESERRRPL